MVQTVIFQFSFSNGGCVFNPIRELPDEDPYDRIVRKHTATGECVIEPTHNCSLVSFVKDLENAGYELVDAFSQKRVNGKHHGPKTYFAVRFVFARREHANPTEDFKEIRKTVSTILLDMCNTALWRVRAYRNPFYKKGQLLEGQTSLSINLEARTPRIDRCGKPLTVWQKDPRGKHIGDAPVPIQPEHYLRINGNNVQLMEKVIEVLHLE